MKKLAFEADSSII